MADKMYWAARCKSCSGMIVYREVRFSLDAKGATVDEELPNGTTVLRCDHCGTVSNLDLCQFRPIFLRLLLGKLP
jgi:DNA-directed RNA polymerase subunit RPC12/RpoP